MKVIKEKITKIKCDECGSKFEVAPSDFEYVRTKELGAVKTVVCPCCKGRLKDEWAFFGLHLWTVLHGEWSYDV